MPFEPAPKAPTKQEIAYRALSDLADFLPTIPDRRWEFEAWIIRGLDNRRLSLPVGKAFCGTVGCAIGHGILSVPSIRALLNFGQDRYTPMSKDGAHPSKALCMSRNQFDDLFTMDGYFDVPSQHQVAQRLRDYLATHK